MGILHLRTETRSFENRTPLIPTHAKKLIEQGHQVFIEKSPNRQINDLAYEQIGCHLVAPGTWQLADKNTYILGLKELPQDNTPLLHKHIYFAHAFKGQHGSANLLQRFRRGSGIIYDLEYLKDDQNKRITTFGVMAGKAGALISVMIWLQKHLEKKNHYIIPSFHHNSAMLIENLQTALPSTIKALIIGGNGRTGTGVQEILKKIGITFTVWGRNDTKNIDHTQLLNEYDILFNCIYLDGKTKPFLKKEHLQVNSRLSVICDISCDPNNDFNPLPIYTHVTTYDNPVVRAKNGNGYIDIIAIDNLPSFLPLESSIAFSNQLIQPLELLLSGHHDHFIWKRAENAYFNAVNDYFSHKMVS